jgi:hypothetical protein
VARGRLQACPSFEASAAAASSALGSTRNFGRDSGRMTLGLYRNRSTGRSANETHAFRGAVRIEP